MQNEANGQSARRVTVLVVGWRGNTDNAIDAVRARLSGADASGTATIGPPVGSRCDAIVAAAFPASLDAIAAVLDVAGFLDGSIAVKQFQMVLHSSAVPDDSTGSSVLSTPWGIDLLGDLHDQILVGASLAGLVDPILPHCLELVRPDVDPGVTTGPREPLYELRRVEPQRGPGQARPGVGCAESPVSSLGWARRAARGWLVDREEASAQIGEAWRASLNGRRRAPILVGEPGMGKTALAAEFALRTAADGAHVIYGRWQRGSRPRYEAIREGVESLAGRRRFDFFHDDRRALDVWKLGSATEHVDPDAAWMGQMLATLLDDLASFRPVLVVLDDLQWADSSSLSLLDGLQGASSQAPWMLLGTRRPGHGDPPGWTDTIVLEGLDAQAVAALIELTLGRAVEPDDETVRWLRADTAGNPLLIHEILRGVDGHKDPICELREARTRPPRDLVNLIRWHLAALPVQTRHVLRHAARIDRVMHVDSLATRLRVAPALVRRALTPAVGEHLLQAGHDGDHYRFTSEITGRIVRTELASDT